MSSISASPGLQNIERTLEATLTGRERLTIGLRLGIDMLALGLLAVGWLQKTLGDPQLAIVAETVIAIGAVLVATPLFVTALHGLVTHDPDSFSEQLVSLAIIAAMASGEYAAAILVPVIMDIGHFLEERSVMGAQTAIDGLSKLHARSATRLTPTGEEQVEPDALRIDDVVLVRPGDILPADGEVVRGHSTVDQSSITGESVPEEALVGSQLFAGSVNVSGAMEVRVTRVGAQTALGRVLALLRDAEQSKAPVMKLLERYAGYYVPVVLMVAAATLFFTRDMSRVVAVLVVSCPCAFVLAGPSAMVAALATASRLGILIKNTKFLESLADIDTVVLDKTGTVTLGHLKVTRVLPAADVAERELLQAASRCAAGSRHPVSAAIVRAACARGIDTSERAVDIREVPGKGVIARDGQTQALLGRREWLVEQDFAIAADPHGDGPVAWVARDDKVLGAILLEDLPRPEATRAVEDLRLLGPDRFILLTGDRRQVAERVASTLGIENVVSEVLPEQKLDVVREQVSEGRSVMVVGDGVNDALALASGHVGVAMGAMGSDVALKSADIALMNNDLRRLAHSIQLSRQTRRVINQNVLIGAGSSILMLALASAGLLPALAGAVLHNFGTVYVVINSARLLRFGNELESGTASAVPNDDDSLHRTGALQQSDQSELVHV